MVPSSNANRVEVVLDVDDEKWKTLLKCRVLMMEFEIFNCAYWRIFEDVADNVHVHNMEIFCEKFVGDNFDKELITKFKLESSKNLYITSSLTKEQFKYKM